MLQWADFEPFRDARGVSDTRPIVPVVIDVSGRRMRTVGLIDSGSDVSFIPYYVAADLKCAPKTFGLSYHTGGRQWQAAT